MAAIPGSVRFTGFIAPSDSDDAYAVHDEIYGRGGWRTVANLTERDAITSDRRRVGMPVRVLDRGDGTRAFYTLIDGITNSHWVLDELGGEWSGAYDTSYVAHAVTLLDGTEFVLAEIDAYTVEGIGYLLTVTPTTSVGQLTVEIYDDVAKTLRVCTHVVDLASPTKRSSYSFGFNAETAGSLYCTLYCSGVPADQTATFLLSAVTASPRGVPTIIPTPYGDGIEDDGTGKPRIALSSTSGLAFSLGKLVISPDETAPVHVAGTALGAVVHGAVDDSTLQSISANKVFDSVGCIPTIAAGYPITGTYATGAEILDSAGIKWRCTAGGTPGTWVLVDNVLDEPVATYSTAVAVGATYLFEVPATGNSGVLLWLRAWGFPVAKTDTEIPFRVRVYETSSALGKELVWQGIGIARQTALTVAMTSPQTYLEVASNDLIEVDEGLMIFEDDSRKEYALCSSRLTGYINISEALVDAGSWDIGTRVLPVTSWWMVPWINKDGNPAKKNTIFIEVRHDGLVGDPDLTFYVQAMVYSMGVVPQVTP
jgi:hypothetical protein